MKYAHKKAEQILDEYFENLEATPQDRDILTERLYQQIRNHVLTLEHEIDSLRDNWEVR